MNVRERIADHGAVLTVAERRVAEVVLSRPQLVAFGTVADLAEAAAAGAATVVRLAGKLGYDGFTELQGAVQAELAQQLRPAAERIREPAGSDLVSRHQQVEVANVQTTLSELPPTVVKAIAERLSDTAQRVWFLSGDASRGIAAHVASELDALRDGVGVIDGNDIEVTRQVARLGERDVIVVIDLRRYDRWVIEAAEGAARRGAWIAAVTDSVLSPLAALAAVTVVVTAVGSGPFDSHVGTLAALNLVVAGVAVRLRDEATARLDQVEGAWRDAGALTDR